MVQLLLASLCVNALFPGVYLGDAYYSVLNNNMERWINKVRRHNQKYFTKYLCETTPASAICSWQAFHLAQGSLERGKYFENNLINFVERPRWQWPAPGLSALSSHLLIWFWSANRAFVGRDSARGPLSMRISGPVCLSAVNIFKKSFIGKSSCEQLGSPGPNYNQ